MSDRQCWSELYTGFGFVRCQNTCHAEGPCCKDHGCAKCGYIILADTEDWPEKLCPEHYYAAGHE